MKRITHFFASDLLDKEMNKLISDISSIVSFDIDNVQKAKRLYDKLECVLLLKAKLKEEITFSLSAYIDYRSSFLLDDYKFGDYMEVTCELGRFIYHVETYDIHLNSIDPMVKEAVLKAFFLHLEMDEFGE